MVVGGEYRWDILLFTNSVPKKKGCHTYCKKVSRNFQVCQKRGKLSFKENNLLR